MRVFPLIMLSSYKTLVAKELRKIASRTCIRARGNSSAAEQQPAPKYSGVLRGWRPVLEESTRRAYINSQARRDVLALLRVSRGIPICRPASRQFSPSLRGAPIIGAPTDRCRNSSNRSSLKHPLAVSNSPGRRTGGSGIALQKLPITYNMQFLPAPVALFALLSY